MQVEITGLTGVIKFDHQGFRSDFTLDIMELNTRNGLENIGTWNTSEGISFTRSYREIYKQMIDSLQNKSFIVTTILVSIFNYLSNSIEEALKTRIIISSFHV